MTQPRILLYSHDTYGLGHLRRSLAIAHSLAAHIPHSRQLLVTGSTVAGAFELPARLDTLKLPSLSKRSSGEYMPRNLPLSLDETIRWRAEMIQQAAWHFKPDLLLVDKAPVGVQGELLPTLQLLKQELPETRIVLGMRDIEDSPEITRAEWEQNGIYPVLENDYDAILLYGQRSVFDPAASYGLSPSIAAKIVECGYLERPRPSQAPRLVRRELGIGEEPFIVVTAGGGGDGFALVDAALAMYESGLAAGSRPLFVTGPLMPQQYRKSLAHRAAAAGLDLLEFTPDLTKYLAAADLVVSMAGYNTVCEILSFQKRAVLVPRRQVRQEQKIRAAALAEMGLARVLDPGSLTPGTLWQAVEASLAGDPPQAALNMDGLANATRAISAILKAPASRSYTLPAGLFSASVPVSIQRPQR